MSSPCHQPEKWNGMNTVSGPTPSVTLAFTLRRTLPPPGFLPGVLTHTYSPARMPRSAAVFGLISTKQSCISSASQGLERVSSPPPSYSTRRPLVSTSGNFLCTSSLTACCCTDLKSVGSLQTTARALALPNGVQPCFIATRWMPPERSFAQVLPSASFFSASVSSSHQPSFFSKTW